MVQCVLLFYFFRYLLRKSIEHPWTDYVALFASAWYGLHTANAETINYIIARSDSFSTLCVVAAFVLFQFRPARSYHLYLIPMVIGILTKETGVMFVPLLWVYVLLFERDSGLAEIFRVRGLQAAFRGVMVVMPALIVALAVFLIPQFLILDRTPLGSIGSPAKFAGRVNYLMSQSVVVMHYLGNFVFPLELSADPDFGRVKGLFNRDVLFSLLGHLALLGMAVVLSGKRRLRPISFGILWFYIALIPTSSLHPLIQMANDHRTFFPFVGLVLSASWLVALALIRWRESKRQKALYAAVISALASLVVLVYGYGAHVRNEVWGSAESLWYDVTRKSPRNGRGLMNYGLTQMAKGNLPAALEYYERSLEFLPHYAYTHINLGILHNSLGDQAKAETYFRNALRYQPRNPDAHFYYARFLREKGRTDEARKHLTRTISISMGYVRARNLLERMDRRLEAGGSNGLAAAKLKAEEKPSPENLLQLSLIYHRQGDYWGCIEAARRALRLRPGYALAYNNICSAYNELKEWDKAIEACRRAIEIKPDFERARNNLNLAKARKKQGIDVK